MKQALLFFTITGLASCGPTRTYSKETCGKYIVTCVYNAGYGKNEFVADSIHQVDKYQATIFVKGKKIELGCDEITAYYNNCSKRD